jgi:hypothetical protein
MKKKPKRQTVPEVKILFGLTYTLKYYTYNRKNLIQKTTHIILTKDLVSTFTNSIENIPSTW